MPTTKEDGKIRLHLPNLFRHPDCRANHGASQNRDAETERILDLAQNDVLKVGTGQIVNQLDLKTSFKEW
jgi:hypothetical protein